MKTKLCKFPSINQYRNIVDTIKHERQYIGKDKDGTPMYDSTLELPTIVFGGTVKLHGQNMGVNINRYGEIWTQSHDNLLTFKEDCCGFALFVEKNKDVFKSLFSNIDFGDYDYITIFGEWCGKGVQRKVAISELEKMFVIFDIKLSYESESQGKNLYLPLSEIVKLRSIENQIFNIYDFKTFEVTVDFNNPQETLDYLTELTMEVENECPVGKHFGVIGMGEGIVWCYVDENGKKYRFKTKGLKHKGSSGKDRKIVEISVEKINSIKEFVDYTVTEPRLEQAIDKVFGSERKLDIRKTGDFLKWIVNDIIKEEIDTLIENDLEPKDVTSSLSIRAKDWFFEELKKF